MSKQEILRKLNTLLLKLHNKGIFNEEVDASILELIEEVEKESTK